MTGETISSTIHTGTGEIASIAFSPDGGRIVSGLSNGTICIWDVETGRLISGPFLGHTKAVTCVAFSPDGRRVASGSYDCIIRVWNAECRQIADEEPTFQDDSILQDGWILGSNNELLFWIPPTCQAGLWRPSNVCVLGPNSTRLDLSRFVHGTSWHHCHR